MSDAGKRLQFLRNKKVFSRRGVIFECEDDVIKICHIPYSGMDFKTAEYLSDWLAKRSWDIVCKRSPKTRKLRADSIRQHGL